jgi:hypothetical protein
MQASVDELLFLTNCSNDSVLCDQIWFYIRGCFIGSHGVNSAVVALRIRRSKCQSSYDEFDTKQRYINY